MFLILSHIKIGFTFQCHNSALSDKTDRIKQFRTGIQMNSGSISKKDSILSSPWYNQFIWLPRTFIDIFFFVLLCCDGRSIWQHPFIVFHLDAVYYYIYIFLLYINSASIGQSQHCLFATRLDLRDTCLGLLHCLIMIYGIKRNSYCQYYHRCGSIPPCPDTTNLSSGRILFLLNLLKEMLVSLFRWIFFILIKSIFQFLTILQFLIHGFQFRMHR